MTDFLTLDETAKILEVSTRTVRIWEKLDRITADPYERGLKFHRLDVERLAKCIKGELILSRRPANVFFDSLRKPPFTINWIGSLDRTDVTILEYFTYREVNKEEIKKLLETSTSNGWVKHGYQDIKLIDPNGCEPRIISINHVDYLLPPVATISPWVKVEVEPYYLDESKLIIAPEYNYDNDEELRETINACPPFIIFHYYDIIDDKIKYFTKFLGGYRI